MKRRQFLVGLAVLSPVGRAFAQAPARTGKALPVVGIYLTSPRKELERDYWAPFVEGMRELGWVDRKNVVYDFEDAPRNLRSPQDNAKMGELAQALVARKPDVIWLASSLSATPLVYVTRHDASGNPIPLAKQIPVVGAAVSEVVKRDLAESLGRPGKNFTGISNFAWELGAKRFELLYDIMPKIARVGVLMVPENANCEEELKIIQKVAAPKRVAIVRAKMEKEDEAEAAFAELAKNRTEAVLIAHHPLFQNHSAKILELAAHHRIPAVGHRSSFSEASKNGALLAYSTVLTEQMRRSAVMVDKILKGTKPGVIPVEQPTKTELVINVDTAKKLGLSVPQDVMIRANKICTDAGCNPTRS